MNIAIKAVQSGLVVSCQAAEGNPLRGPQFMAAMARAAAAGGAVGLRAEGPDDVAAVVQATGLPVIGILKTANQGPDCVYITPTYADAALVVAAGASIVATDGTARPRPNGEDLATLIRRIHDELGVPVMADVDSLESGKYAEQAGADILATTLSGYTEPGALRPAPTWSCSRNSCGTARCPSSQKAGSGPPRTSRRPSPWARTPWSSAPRSPIPWPSHAAS